MIIGPPPGISSKIKREAQEAYRVYATAALQALIAHRDFNSIPGDPEVPGWTSEVAHNYAIAMMKKEAESLSEIIEEYYDSLQSEEEE